MLPHFDKMPTWSPDVLTRPFFRDTGGATLVGIDEDTVLVGGPTTFTVQGRQSAWILDDGRRQEFRAGASVHLPQRPPA